MKAFLIALLYVLFFSYCKSNNSDTAKNEVKETNQKVATYTRPSVPYTLENTAEINKLLRTNKIFGLEEIAIAYYNVAVTKEGNERLTFYPEVEKVPKRVTILHEDIPDDSLRSIKIILIINEQENQVSEIRKSIRCWPNRGSGMWSAGPCV